MSDNSKPSQPDLTMRQCDALRECARWKRGTYTYKPRTMFKLAEMGLTESIGNGAYALTQAGLALLPTMNRGRNAGDNND